MNPIKISATREYEQTLRKFLESEEVQAYTMATLSFFALAFFSIFAIRPTLISFFNLQKQIEDAKIVEKKLDTKINSLLAAQEEYQKNQFSIALLDTALPAEPLFPELVKKIENLVNEQEATISAFNTGSFSLLQKKSKAAPSSTVNTVDFNMTTSADYTKNESFLNRLLNLRRIITLKLLDFSTSVKDKDRPIDTQIDASAYYTGGAKTQ